MPLLTLNNVSVRLGKSWVLWDVGLEINSADLVAVFGKSGSGKTVLTAVLAGLIKPTRGSVERCGQDSDEDLPRGVATIEKDRIWVMPAFENPTVAPELTVYENLCLFASLSGTAYRSRSRQIAYMLEFLDLTARRNAKPSELSTGELKRVEIGRVFLADSPVVVIDSLLDSIERGLLEKVWDHILSERRAKGRTFVLTTRSSRIASLCPRITVLHRGRNAFTGRPEDFRKLGGQDMVVLTELANPALQERISERLSVIIKEEEGFLSFRVSDAEKTISSLLAEFGSEIGCVYLRRPTLDDALEVLESGTQSVAAHEETA